MWCRVCQRELNARQRRPHHAGGRLVNSPWRRRQHAPRTQPYPTLPDGATSRQCREHVSRYVPDAHLRVFNDAERPERVGVPCARTGRQHPSPALCRSGPGLPRQRGNRRKIVCAPGALVSLAVRRSLLAVMAALGQEVWRRRGAAYCCCAFLALSPSRHASTHFERAPSIDIKRTLALLSDCHNAVGLLIISGTPFRSAVLGLNRRIGTDLTAAGGVVIQAGGLREREGLGGLPQHSQRRCRLPSMSSTSPCPGL
ncbi:hypothetical protein EV122DRAFT_286197 [Schizophyllum commune]